MRFAKPFAAVLWTATLLLLISGHPLQARAFVVMRKQWAFLNLSSVPQQQQQQQQSGDLVAPTATTQTTKTMLLSDSALYGINSPLNAISGPLVSALSLSTANYAGGGEGVAGAGVGVASALNNVTTELNDRGCSSYVNAQLPPGGYIALVSRGDCSFDTKISVAAKSNAIGIIVYNNEQDVFTMLAKNDSIVSVLVSNYVGSTILAWLQLNGTQTFVTIQQGAIEIVENNSLPSSASVYFVGFTFILVIVITFFWICVYMVQKYRYINTKKRLDGRLKKATLKAISKMTVRAVKDGDKELAETCAICLENYAVNDQVRELPCRHYFHQADIDMWLLENRNCPMCKIDILQAYGIEVKRPRGFWRRHMNFLRLRPSSFEHMITNRMLNNQAVAVDNERRRNLPGRPQPQPSEAITAPAPEQQENSRASDSASALSDNVQTPTSLSSAAVSSDSALAVTDIQNNEPVSDLGDADTPRVHADADVYGIKQQPTAEQQTNLELAAVAAAAAIADDDDDDKNNTTNRTPEHSPSERSLLEPSVATLSNRASLRLSEEKTVFPTGGSPSKPTDADLFHLVDLQKNNTPRDRQQRVANDNATTAAPVSFSDSESGSDRQSGQQVAEMELLQAVRSNWQTQRKHS